MKVKRNKIILISIIIILILCFIFIPQLNSLMKTSIKTLSTQGIDGIILYIRQFGAYAIAVSFFLMVLQSIIAPIPAFLITLSNAAIWGWKLGALISWSSAMVGAGLCFFIARVLGRDVVEKFTGRGTIKEVDKFFKKYGKYTIIIARLLPFVPFDPVSYVAGLTGMTFIGFMVATGIGQLPATIVYSYVGGTLSGGPKFLMFGLLALFALTILIYIVKKVYEDRQNKNI